MGVFCACARNTEGWEQCGERELCEEGLGCFGGSLLDFFSSSVITYMHRLNLFHSPEER